MAKRAKRRGRVGLSGVSIASLEAEISRRRRKAGSFHKVRNRLLARLAKIESKIMAAGGELMDAARSRVGGGRRAKNAMSLVEALQKVLKTKTLSVTEAAEAVQRAGYTSNSKTFRTIVNQALIKHTDKFKKVSRGQYTTS